MLSEILCLAGHWVENIRVLKRIISSFQLTVKSDVYEITFLPLA